MTVPTQPGLEASIGSLTQQDAPPHNGAQSPNPSPSSFAHGANGERTFTADDIARARKEEKDKLYPEITALKDQWSQAQKTLDSLQAQRQAELDEIERLKKEKESKLKAKKDEEMSAKQLLEERLAETQREFAEKISRIESEREAERALLAKERAYQELTDYRSAKIAEAGNTVAPEFYDFINGNNKEQIDSAIARAQESTKSILDQVTQAQSQRQQGNVGVRPTGYPAMGLMDSVNGQRPPTPEEINAMTMAEFAEYRQKNGMAKNEAQRNRGLFN
jgi:hypothetical protein